MWIPIQHLDQVLGRMVDIKCFCNVCKKTWFCTYDPEKGRRNPYYQRFVGDMGNEDGSCDDHQIDLFKILNDEDIQRNHFTLICILEKLGVNNYRGRDKEITSEKEKQKG